MKIRELLKEYFGFNDFRKDQLKIIKSICNDRKDTFVLMSTGSGKSICYQIPGLFYSKLFGKKTIVISPLLSLMEDQVANLQQLGISAVYLGSSQNDRDAEKDAKDGKYTFIYLTPEKAVNWIDSLLYIHEKFKIALFAIDEAHCVSEWGHDFRPEYRQLAVLKKTFPQVPVLALTATATQNVSNEIVANLRLKNCAIFKTTFNRENLSYFIKTKTIPELDILPLVKKVTEGIVIVYCLTKKDTDNIAEMLQKKGISCKAYHAGKSFTEKTNIYNDFRNDKLKCLVATVAFGMGIDKANVRRIIHYGPPKSIETYYQQSGRAGRDSLPADCILFWKESDFVKLYKISGHEKNSKFLISEMRNYVLEKKCLRKKILEYFDDNTQVECFCKKCISPKSEKDNDLESTDSTNSTNSSKSSSSNDSKFLSVDVFPEDCSKEMFYLLRSIMFLGNRFGMTMPINLLLGSTNAKLAAILKNSREIFLFGKGKNYDSSFWKSLFLVAETENLVEIASIEYKTYKVSQKGYAFLSTFSLEFVKKAENNESLTDVSYPLYQYKIKKKEKTLKRKKYQFDAVLKNLDKNLLENLKIFRKKEAERLHVPLYLILNDSVLYEISTKKPKTSSELLDINGIGLLKMEKYGKNIIDLVKNKI